MKRYIARFFLSFILVCCLCAAGFCQDKNKLAQERPPNVLVGASETTKTSSGKSTITLTLTVRPGVAIYTNEPHPPDADLEYLLPTTIELLDQQGKIDDAELEFPPGTPVEYDKSQVYTGAVKVTAKFPADRPPEKLKLKYYGYWHSGSVDSPLG